MQQSKKIGSFKNQFFIEDFTTKFFNWMKTDVVLWFFWCIYDEKEISDKFENADTIIKKRKIQMKFIDIMSQDSETYSSNEILSLIKDTLPKLYSALPTIGKFKANVEAGKFTGCDDGHIRNVALGFADDYFNHRSFGGRRWDISISEGSPLLNATGGEWKQIINTIPYDPKVDYTKDYQADIFGFMVDVATGMSYVDANGNKVSTPLLAPGFTTIQDPIGNPAIEANRNKWNTTIHKKNMYGDFNIDELGYMVSQLDSSIYVNAYGVKVAAKQLVNGLTAELVPGKNDNGNNDNSGFSLAGIGLPVILVAGGLLLKLFNRNK